MHNLKEIRKNFDDFKDALKGRFLKIDVNELKDLDIKNRNFIQKKESLENEKKEISKSKDEKLFKKSKEISNEIDEISKFLPEKGNTTIKIKINDKNNHYSFQLKNKRNIDRKTINLLRNKEISAIIS